MKKIFKKYLAISLTVLMLFYSAGYPVISYAQEVASDLTPTETPAVTPTNTPTDTPSPTPDDSVSPTPTPALFDESVTPTEAPPATNDNTAVVSTEATTTSNTGGNNVSSGSSPKSDNASNNNSNSQNSESTSTTGDAVSVTSVENDVNSNSVNSSVVMQTINIYVDQNGDLNLSDPYKLATQAIQDHPNDPIINMSVVNVSNFAYVTNTIVSTANTGNNIVDSGEGNSSISTGNAYSTVSLLNKVNFTIINSTIHIVTINVFGSLNGNIILPENPENQDCIDCPSGIDSQNSAVVGNTVDSSANSGENTASASSDNNTGDAKSVVNVLNLVNQNFVNSNIESLFINILGDWDGSFVGWYEFGAQPGGESLALSDQNQNSSTCDLCPDTEILNTAIVNNKIVSNANTGGNNINGGSGKITSGNAFSAVSLINFINSNFINSTGFFGFLNIFGNWHGNIGGQKQIANSSSDNQLAQSEPENKVNAANNSDSSLESGGALAIDSKNNVADHVNPGDTVTFFVDVKNTGGGKIYGAKLNLRLIQDGKDAGGAEFNLGDIPANKTLHVSTGFVLSQTVNGKYTARATATGSVGPLGESISAVSDSIFNVLGVTATLVENNQLIAGASTIKLNPYKASYLLPYSASKSSTTGNFNYIWILLSTMTAYTALRFAREKEKISFLFSNTNSLTVKLKTLKMILL